MRPIINGSPSTKEMWGETEIMNHLKCDKEMARRILENYHNDVNDHSYGAVEKALILDYIERKQREEREREARHQSDIANVESIAILKEQVKTLKEMCKSSSRDAQKARNASYISNAIAIASLIVAIVSILLNVN
ncbi:MAG: hypothetical protein NC411_00205 [Bacteroides sp.]|nr:hypothetical protein [Bacteroides sp.]